MDYMQSPMLQTSVEISFLGSPKDSIFYSIARFLFIRMQYCAATIILWKIASRAQNRLQIIWISIDRIESVDPHMAPIVSTVEPLALNRHHHRGVVVLQQEAHI